MAPCPPGTQASADLRFCEPCKGGDFNLQAGGTCRPCPMGADCPAGDRLEALPDWWCAAATQQWMRASDTRSADSAPAAVTGAL